MSWQHFLVDLQHAGLPSEGSVAKKLRALPPDDLTRLVRQHLLAERSRPISAKEVAFIQSQGNEAICEDCEEPVEAGDMIDTTEGSFLVPNTSNPSCESCTVKWALDKIQQERPAFPGERDKSTMEAVVSGYLDLPTGASEDTLEAVVNNTVGDRLTDRLRVGTYWDQLFETAVALDSLEETIEMLRTSHRSKEDWLTDEQREEHGAEVQGWEDFGAAETQVLWTRLDYRSPGSFALGRARFYLAWLAEAGVTKAELPVTLTFLQKVVEPSDGVAALMHHLKIAQEKDG